MLYTQIGQCATNLSDGISYPYQQDHTKEMPLRKKPSLLVDLSLQALVKNLLDACRRHPQGNSQDIQSYASCMPINRANMFMEMLLKEATGKKYRGIDFSDAICPGCTRLELLQVAFRDSTVVGLVLDNLYKMKGLTHLHVGSYISMLNKIDAVITQLPCLGHLESLDLIGIQIVNYHKLTQNLVEHCRYLKELRMQWKSEPNGGVTLGGCLNLRFMTIYCEKECIEDILHVLDTVPQLERLILIPNMVTQVLEHVQGVYQLKSLGLCDDKDLLSNNTYSLPASVYPIVIGAEQLASLAQHFPQLQEVQVSHYDDASLVNCFSGLKMLSIVNPPAGRVFGLAEAVVSQLVYLSLNGINNVSSMLGGIRSLPKMTSLTLYQCCSVDLAQINSLCQNLEHLLLSKCTMVFDVPRDTGSQFQHLTHAAVIDYRINIRREHLTYLLSHCQSITYLRVIADAWNDCGVHQLLRLNPMTQLQVLNLVSNSVTTSILSVVVDYFGSSLSEVYFDGKLMKLRKSTRKEVWRMIAPYRIRMWVGLSFFGP